MCNTWQVPSGASYISKQDNVYRHYCLEFRYGVSYFALDLYPQKSAVPENHVVLIILGVFLTTHINRQGVDISFTVFFVTLCVCTFTNFFAEDKASGVKLCTAVLRRPGQGISHFRELCSPRSSQKPKIGLIRCVARAGHLWRGRCGHAHGPRVRSACVDIRPSRRRTYLFYFSLYVISKTFLLQVNLIFHCVKKNVKYPRRNTGSEQSLPSEAINRLIPPIDRLRGSGEIDRSPSARRSQTQRKLSRSSELGSLHRDSSNADMDMHNNNVGSLAQLRSGRPSSHTKPRNRSFN